ncbi:2-dehydropantoate 2-reductase [Microdochium nivale]|nr:2-dehydropantoate 2-reductase [Microdochium nivale]
MLANQASRFVLGWGQRTATQCLQTALPGKRHVHAIAETSVAWLKKTTKDRSGAPTLYAWTAANLGSRLMSPPVTEKSVAACNSQPARNDPERIFILGVGNLGRLFASGLAKLSRKPPITLVVHRKALLEQWNSCPGIEIWRHGRVERFADFEMEWWTTEKPPTGPVQELAPVTNLILATKASEAMPQVDRLRRYLDKNSTVVFAQNGMCKLWPPVGELYQSHRFPCNTGPSWLACVTTHGVTSLGPFSSKHAAAGKVSAGSVSLNPESGDAHRYVQAQMVRAPDLSCEAVSMADLWVLQLEKLVINSVINPLTAILDCQNGEIFVDRGDMLHEIVNMLIREASIVLNKMVRDPASTKILAGGDCDLSSRSSLTQLTLSRRFSFSSLRNTVYEVGRKVGENTSSMLQDVRAARQTEVQDFNGWFVETARMLNLANEVSTHQKMVSMVEDGRKLSRKQLVEHCG